MGVTLSRGETGATNNGFDFLFGGGTLVACLHQYIFFNQNASEIVRPCQQSQLTGRHILAEPRGLNVVKVVQHQPRHRNNSYIHGWMNALGHLFSQWVAPGFIGPGNKAGEPFGAVLQVP